MSGHEINQDSQYSNFLSIYDGTKGDIGAVAQSGAKDQVTYAEEFQTHQTLIFFSYEFRNGRWQSEGKTPEQLIDPDKPGADRIGRVLDAERLLEGSDASHVIIPSEEIGEGRNYLYVITKGVDGHRQGIAIEHQGTDSDFRSLVQHLSKDALNGNEKQDDRVDFTKPLLFETEFHPEAMAQTIQKSYTSTNSFVDHREYLSRLNRDTNNFSLLFQKHNDQVIELARQYESVIHTYDDVRQGFWAVTAYMMESVKEQSNKAVRGSSIDTVTNYTYNAAISVAGNVVSGAKNVIGEFAVYIQDSKRREEEKKHVKRLPVAQKMQSNPEKDNFGAQSPLMQTEWLIPWKIREQSISPRGIINKRHTQIRQGMKEAQIVTEARVGVKETSTIHSPFIDKLPVRVWSTEESIGRHKKKELRMKRRELKKRKRATRKDSVMVQFQNTNRVEFMKTGKKEIRRKKSENMRNREQGLNSRSSQRVRREKSVKRNSTAEKFILIGREKVKTKNNRAREDIYKLRRNRKNIWQGQRVTQRGEAKPAKIQTIKKERKISVLASKESILRSWKKRGVLNSIPILEAKKEQFILARARFAWLLYWFLSSERNVIKLFLNPQQTEGKQSGAVLEKQDNRERRNGSFFECVGSPWILLSIIWYLAMMREQGSLSNQISLTHKPHLAKATQGKQIRQMYKTKRKQNTKLFQHHLFQLFPQQAVIFAFGS